MKKKIRHTVAKRKTGKEQQQQLAEFSFYLFQQFKNQQHQMNALFTLDT